MPRLSLKSKNSRETAELNVYSLSFDKYHEKVGQVKKSGTLKLEEGPYKVEAVDGDHSFQKIVLVDGNVTVLMDFAEHYTPLDITDDEIRKALIIGAAIGATGILLMYFVGFELLSEHITL